MKIIGYILLIAGLAFIGYATYLSKSIILAIVIGFVLVIAGLMEVSPDTSSQRPKKEAK